MKPNQHRRAFVALIPATLLLAAPGFAQEAVTPPPVVLTVPQAAPAAPAPQAAAPQAAPQNASPQPLANGVSARNGIGDPASATPIAPEAMEQAEQGRAARTAPRQTTRATATSSRSTPSGASARQIAPVAATSAPVAAPAPVAAAPEAAPASTTPPVETTAPAQTPAQPEATTADTATTDTATTSTQQGAPVWPWIVGGLVILGGLIAFFLRRRSRANEEEYYEVYEEPVVQAEPEPVVATAIAERPQYLRPEPVAAAPVAPIVAAASAEKMADAVEVEAELADPEAEDVAALTSGPEHADRPWLEFAMRPVRAGSSAEDALVEIELTVGNSGAVEARDVRISTFMFADGSASRSEMERLLTDHSRESEVAPITIGAGEGTRVDATLSLSKQHLGDEARAFNPVIVADARYRLADGSEGRTSASFEIGMIGDNEDMRGISLHRPQMSDDIEARLHGVPEHA